jgi:hypothetical protein
MDKRLVLRNVKRARGNPNCGKPLQSTPAFLTEFEMEVERLGLKRSDYVVSAELKLSCDRNRNRVYVPEWRPKEWGMQVDTNLSAA